MAEAFTLQFATQARAQQTIENALTNFKKIGRNNLTPAKIRSRITALKETWAQFQQGHDVLLGTVPAETQSSSDYFKDRRYEKTEDIFQSTLDTFFDTLEEFEPYVSPNQSLNATVRSDVTAFSQSYFPKISLPSFDGKSEEWEHFRDRFTALIKNNKDLNDFSRMHFLTSCLKGRALDCISSLTVTADNFEIAWQALTARFENKQRSLQAHLSSLLNMPAIPRESIPELQNLIDKANIAVSALKNLNRSPEDLWNDILVHMLVQKIDPVTRKAWKLKHGDSVILPDFDDLIRFLRVRTRALEELTPAATIKSSQKSAKASSVHTATAESTSQATCPLCNERHFLNKCPTFVSKNPSERFDFVKQQKRCVNCLSNKHSAFECKSKYSCRSCHKKHHSMLHFNSDSRSNQSLAIPSDSSSSQPIDATSAVNSLFAANARKPRSQVLLATAWVTVRAPSGRTLAVRALLDQGSEMTFISENLAQTLQVKRIHMPIAVSTVGGIHAGTFRHATQIFISPRHSLSPSFSTTALILKSLTSYTPKRDCNLSSLSHLSHLQWADSDPTSADPIHIILGAEIYNDLILDGVQKGGISQPIAQNSVLGWVISGPIKSSAANSQSCSIHHSVPLQTNIYAHHILSSSSLEEELRRFWEVEELPRQSILTPQDEQCEEHFRSTHSRDADGRYIVRLPFKRDPPIDIGHSRYRAEKLLTSLINRLRDKPELQNEYQNFLSEYERLGHMQPAAKLSSQIVQAVYIPHHAVIRESSTTTRLRVVFNASSVTSNGTSLNDHLLAGPKLQTDITSVILRWRQYKFVYNADIAKMYRQIRINSRDVDYQRILWKPSSTTESREYQLLTVTYGMACAPFLALRVLKQLVDDEGQQFPLAVPILRENIYVDDVLFGANDTDTARQARDQLISLLHRGGFELKKWASNSSSLLSDIDPADHGLACAKQLDQDEIVKVLGIAWKPPTDSFEFHVSLSDTIPKSKRSILSIIAKLYDPLGWVTPVTIKAKIFMQQLWRAKLGWDDYIDDNLLAEWNDIYSRLSHIDGLQIVRWNGLESDTCYSEIHGFADASNVAYAAAVYLKVVSSSGKVTITLLSSKSKVAPLKPLSIPRLELSAALLLARLMDFIRETIGSKDIPCYCWTDSTVVLAWVTQHPSRWKTFVANRVLEIQSRLPSVEWRHVSTHDNPADCASRGIFGDNILTFDLWWHGPPWLIQQTDSWPHSNIPLSSTAPLEEKVVARQCSVKDETWDLASRFSSWPTLIRVTSYVIRFLRSCRYKCSRRPMCFSSLPMMSASPASSTLALSVDECTIAKTFWIKKIQAELFFSEITALSKNQSISSKSSLLSLRPFLDRDGVLRVGGRLRKAPLPFPVRHPILLSSHQLVTLIVAQAHLRALHAGPQLTMSILRRDFWIIRVRHIVKSVIHNCIICTRERAAIPSQLMGDLPELRVSPSTRSFLHCGIDYAGPVSIRASAGRGITSRKAYIALFICLATKAIHLELVGDYSTAVFLNAFSRFCARRGLPQAMYSDNGTTFVGADREMTLAFRSAQRDPNFLNMTASDNIRWNFIPPSAPHFGGLWEAGVKSVKHHLRRVLGSHTLTFEEFSTLLCRIEACLNSRPLAPLSDTLDDYECLTPGHFLIGSALTVNPEPSLLELKEDRLSRWQLIRHITERFWKLWQNDYVNTLQQRAKWRKVKPPIKIGQLVLIRNSTIPPCKWELGRVTQCHPGSDGYIRVVTVKTANSEYKRPISKLCVLPVETETTSCQTTDLSR